VQQYTLNTSGTDWVKEQVRTADTDRDFLSLELNRRQVKDLHVAVYLATQTCESADYRDPNLRSWFQLTDSLRRWPGFDGLMATVTSFPSGWTSRRRQS